MTLELCLISCSLQVFLFCLYNNFAVKKTDKLAFINVACMIFRSITTYLNIPLLSVCKCFVAVYDILTGKVVAKETEEERLCIH